MTCKQCNGTNVMTKTKIKQKRGCMGILMHLTMLLLVGIFWIPFILIRKKKMTVKNTYKCNDCGYEWRY